MTGKRLFGMVLAAVLPVTLLAVPAAAAEPEQLNFPAFAVVPVTESGAETDQFGSRDVPHFDIKFALALSATRSYPVRFTLIQDANGKIAETVLFEGSLDEGTYSFLARGEQPPGYGDITAKVVMRVRMFSKRFTGDDFYVYRQWEGTYRYGK